MTMSEEMRRIRSRLEMTQKHFATCLGIAGNTVARYERDERRVPVPTLRLARRMFDDRLRAERSAGEKD
ncbi:MAG: hypothetical protein QGD93_10270 [Actinomycetota bacterium]|nr:hypothetical protein [Actinomycetota bacterium]